MRSAGQTFDTKLDATTWLASQARDVERGIWQPPTEKLTAGTVRSYAEAWLTGRDIKPKTRWQYRRFLDAMILPALGDVPLDKLTPTTVRNWHASLDPTKATWRAHACSLLRTIYTTAVTDDLVPTNPCRIRGAGTSKKKHTTTVATAPPPRHSRRGPSCSRPWPGRWRPSPASLALADRHADAALGADVRA
jgi:hypothetical protein